MAASGWDVKVTITRRVAARLDVQLTLRLQLNWALDALHRPT